MKVHKIFILISILALVMSTGCAIIDNSKYRLSSASLSYENSALVLFRTETCSMGCTTGIAVRFKNTATDEQIVNLQGFLGHGGDGFHAFWFPEGEYSLESVFFYNGAMRPEKEGFKVKVATGETLYIGTILKSWGGLPKPIIEYGPLRGVKTYCRGGYNPDACITKAEVAIVDEGDEVIDIFRERFPNINQSVKIRLLQ